MILCDINIMLAFNHHFSYFFLIHLISSMHGHVRVFYFCYTSSMCWWISIKKSILFVQCACVQNHLMHEKNLIRNYLCCKEGELCITKIILMMMMMRKMRKMKEIILQVTHTMNLSQTEMSSCQSLNMMENSICSQN